MFADYVQTHTPRITKLMTSFFTEKARELTGIFPLGNDAVNTIHTLAQGGKLIRAGLVVLGAEMRGRGIDEDVLKVSVATQLYHTAFLIHDDIIDNDRVRHGKPSVYAHYADVARKEKLVEATDFGKNMAICIGDMSFFMGDELVATIADMSCIPTLMTLFSRELTHVALAELSETYQSVSPKRITKDTILSIYRYKTARYSIVLPLLAGSILSNQSPSTMKLLETYGEAAGILYQIKDDELGMAGDEKVIGKPVGSDIREGKKTIYYLELMNHADAQDKKRLASIFGNKKASEKDIAFVRSCVSSYNIEDTIQTYVKTLYDEAYQTIQILSVTSEYKTLLESLLDYTKTRTY